MSVCIAFTLWCLVAYTCVSCPSIIMWHPIFNLKFIMSINCNTCIYLDYWRIWLLKVSLWMSVERKNKCSFKMETTISNLLRLDALLRVPRQSLTRRTSYIAIELKCSMSQVNLWTFQSVFFSLCRCCCLFVCFFHFSRETFWISELWRFVT